MPIDQIARDVHSATYNPCDLLERLATDPDVVEAHRRWEDIDAQWRKEKRTHSRVTENMLMLAARTRMAMANKDRVFDRAAALACQVAENSGVLESYDRDILGHARAVANVPELSPQWHDLRRGGVGGSQIGEALGYHWKGHPGQPQHISPAEKADMWAQMAVDKLPTDDYEPPPTSGVLYRGHTWEPALLVRHALTNNLRIAVSKATWQSPWDIQRVNIDGIMLDDSGDPYGIVECKTSSRTWTWDHGVPIRYRAQVLWYLHATGLDVAHVLVKFDSGAFNAYTLHAGDSIDGTTSGPTIEDCREEIDRHWATLTERVNNPRLIFDTSPMLSQTGRCGELLTTVNSAPTIYRVDGDYAVVHIDTLAPYVRMPDEATVPVYADALYPDNGENIRTSFAHLYDPAIYDVTGLNTPRGTRENSWEQWLDSLDPRALIVADNASTYAILGRSGLFPRLVDLSAVRRRVECSPRAPEFSGVLDAATWMGRTLPGAWILEG